MIHEVFNNTDIGFIAGSHQVFAIGLYELSETLNEDILISNLEWRMARYGESECIVSKTSGSELLYSHGIVKVILNDSETKNLYGKFTHQLIVTDDKEKKFVLDLGNLSIKRLIQ